MMYLLLHVASAGGCTPIALSELATTPAPAVFVLGERRGTQPDLARATRLVGRLRATGEAVTVALQAVSHDLQPVLDRYADGSIPTDALPDELNWGSRWGFPWAPYRPLVTGALHGDTVVGIGHEPAPQPNGTAVPRAPGYARILADAMSGHPMPAELEGRFVQMVSWLDHRMARSAAHGWSNDGYLVVVVDRLHVEGAKGVPWQLQRMVEAPVIPVLLGDPGACYPQDRYLDSPLDFLGLP